jgi:CRISPR/Cas system CSM-associated protein Csm3 (group 7 of RAMP superfamily)
MEIEGVDDEAKAFALISKTILSEKGIALGAKTANGFGKIFIDSISFCKLDFSKKEDIILWLTSDFSRKDNLTSKSVVSLKQPVNELFIHADFGIKTSLLIKNYYDPFLNENDIDSVHLKSNNTNILSGSSVKGALRGRSERIIHTLGLEPGILTDLFGDVEKDKNGKPKKNGKALPARLFIDETFISGVSEEVQHRIKIDRFSGGTIEGALFDSIPLFPKRTDATHDVNFRITIRVEKAKDDDLGLLLLLLKDLGTGDLPLGGEKNIGRGVLSGKKIKIDYKGRTFQFNTPEELEGEQIKVLDTYVKSLINNKRKY